MLSNVLMHIYKRKRLKVFIPITLFMDSALSLAIDVYSLSACGHMMSSVQLAS